MIQVAIVEDDPAAASLLREHLARYSAEKEAALVCTLYPDGAAFCEDHAGQFDVIFLDVQMPHMDGFMTAREIRRTDPAVLLLFLTNAAQYAINGYEVDALDYIVKPLQYETFRMKFDKVLRLLATHQGKSILISRRGETQKVRTDRICYIEIFNHQLIYHTIDGDFSQTGSTSLQSLEQELSDNGFVRCHNGYLVNLQYVDKTLDDKVLVCGQSLPISRGRKKAFCEALLAYYRGRTR